MDNSQLKKISSEFLDIQPFFKEKKHLLQEARQFRRRLKTKLNEYHFLKTLVGIDVRSDELDSAIKKCFDAFGFDKTECIGKKFGEEDIRLWFGKKLIIFEATGSKKEICEQNKMFQIHKHIPIKREQFKDFKVYGGFIVNHDNLKPFENRVPSPFNQDADKYAKGQNIVLLSTLDLLKSFINFKKGKLELERFAEQLCTPGVFKILET